MIRHLFLLILLMLFRLPYLNGQTIEIYPTNWWTGMKMNNIQLLIRDTNNELGNKQATINYPGIKVTKAHSFENKKYIALDITIAPEAKPGKVKIELKGDKKSKTVEWSLDQKREGNGKTWAQGVTSEDFIDLLITDRFSNGDPSNDKVAGMRDQSLNRSEMYLRHGGDLKGIINHIDYFKSLGVTTLWLLPVMENDRPERTEHGYAITNHYKIDPRFGGNEMYKKLSDDLHKNDMKLIMDAVYNHIGLEHFLEQDPPANDWMHRWPAYTQTTYREQTHFDPYATKIDKKRMTDGWFDKIMPDINHENPYMANYLIQNMVWYIQEFGIDGVRVDTYTYSDLDFANRCNKALLDEYPQLTIFGETKVNGTINQAYFNENIFNTSFKSNLPGSVDFQLLHQGIIPALTEPNAWDRGVYRLYNTLSQDFIYPDPLKNVLILDNHDEARFFSVVNGDVEKQKIAFQWLLTYRGIPQLYYGSEVLLKGIINPDGLVRSDFPGGWAEDKKSAFTKEGLSKEESEVLELVKTMGTYRKSSSALKTGKTMHYVPEDGLYVYFRYDDKQTVMCILNTDTKERKVEFPKYSERTIGFTKAKNVINSKSYTFNDNPVIPAMQMWVLELGK